VSVTAPQRFTKRKPCPVCRGGDDLPRGQGRRCSGFLSDDGAYAHCTREEHAGQLGPTGAEPATFAHRLEGECRCGLEHSPPPLNGRGERRRIAATHDYIDEHGQPLYQVVRYEPKDFRQRRQEGNGWTWKLGDTRRVLYRLPHVLGAIERGAPVYVVEGEKDVHAIEDAGAVATCNPMGAGKWRPEFTQSLVGATSVHVVADSDEQGRTHAATVAASLREAGIADVEILEAAVGNDASDHLGAGRTLDQLIPTVSAEPSPVGEPADLRYFHLTDTGNAERLVARHGRDLRYCHPWAAWLVWTGRRWQADNTGEPARRMKETLRAFLDDVRAADDDEMRKKLLKHALDSESAARVRAALESARSEAGIPVLPEQLDAHPMLLAVANGVIDLQTGELLPHSREHLLTKSAPVAYNPAAVAPTWEAFLERVLPDPELRAFVQRYLGYSLTGLTGEQVLAILYGTGANGKSTLIEAVRDLLGDYGQQAPAETFLERRDTIPNDIARLRGARLVAATELAEGRRLNESLVKRMTGGDTMVARFMRAEWFEFEMNAKVVLATNHRPEIRGTDEAIWRRIRLVPFSVTIPAEERDHELPGKLRAELPGILNWAIEGCLAWQRDGLGTAAAVDTATAQYRREMDLLGEFLEDRCVIDENAEALAGPLYNCFTAWAEQSGQKERLSQQAFGRRLGERGFTQARRNTGRWWLGLGIRHDEDHDA